MGNNTEGKFRWYIVQTYSGFEKIVMEDIKRRAETMGMQELIADVIVPEETIIEKNKDGIEKEKTKQMYPGYVFINMNVTDDSWYVVRNTPKVTGFLGSSGGGTKPVPLPDEEIKPILLNIGILQKANYNHLIGRPVEIIRGPFEGQQVEVIQVDNEREKLIVNVTLFNRSTPTEISFDEFKEL